MFVLVIWMLLGGYARLRVWCVGVFVLVVWLLCFWLFVLIRFAVVFLLVG